MTSSSSSSATLRSPPTDNPFTYDSSTYATASSHHTISSDAPLLPPTDDNAPPTYADLAAAEEARGNSRWGRWKTWVEKRVRESGENSAGSGVRTGWGDGVGDGEEREYGDEREVLSRGQLPSTSPSMARPHQVRLLPTAMTLLPLGSRFISDTPSRPLCALPVSDGGARFLLLGTVTSLHVLDLVPFLSGSSALRSANGVDGGLGDARGRAIWTGLGVCALEMLSGGEDGLVLALVGVDTGRTPGEPGTKELRIYTLSSLIQLARWATHQDVPPLDLAHSSWPSTSTTPPRSATHKRGHSGFRAGIRSLFYDSYAPSSSHVTPYTASSSAGTSSSSTTHLRPPSPMAPATSSDDESTWSLVEASLPVAWASDYVPLAAPGSKLAQAGSVILFETHRTRERGSREMIRLAVATKATVLLYELKEGRKSFQFDKEFYTPFPARSISFVQHLPPPPSPAAPQTSTTSSRRSIFNPSSRPAEAQLSLFISFGSKAVICRVADSVVTELDAPPVATHHHSSSSSSHRSLTHHHHHHHRLSTSSLVDGPPENAWLPCREVAIPLGSGPPTTPPLPSSLFLLTRGQHTWVVLSPLPARHLTNAAVHVFSWAIPPTDVVPRVHTADDGETLVLTATAFTEDGFEAREQAFKPLSSAPSPLSQSPTTATDEYPRLIRVSTPGAEEPGTSAYGSQTAYLCPGGRWNAHGSEAICADDDGSRGLGPFKSALSNASSASDLPANPRPVAPFAAHARPRDTLGMYACACKLVGDWRVVWLGLGEYEEAEDRAGWS